MVVGVLRSAEISQYQWVYILQRKYPAYMQLCSSQVHAVAHGVKHTHTAISDFYECGNTYGAFEGYGAVAGFGAFRPAGARRVCWCFVCVFYTALKIVLWAWQQKNPHNNALPHFIIKTHNSHEQKKIFYLIYFQSMGRIKLHVYVRTATAQN